MLANVHDAKTHLSALLERVAAGEEIVIGKAGRPVARLVPYDGAVGPQIPGGWEGRVEVGPDFDDLPEDAAAFAGEGK